MRSPITWFGGKGKMVKKILSVFPPHNAYRIYVEPFGGGASILFAKEPSPVEVYNDLDSGLVNFFRVLREPKKFKEFYRKVCLTPYAREEFEFCKKTWEDCDDEVERAYRFFVVARMSFSGMCRSFNFSVTKFSRGMAGTCSRWLSTIEQLPEISQRLLRVQIEHKDWRSILDNYDTHETLFYLDPPYISETRRGGGYRCEMSIDDHRELVNALLNVKGMAILSGYVHEIYKPLEDAGWQRKDWDVPCHAVGKTRASGLQGKGACEKNQRRIESVWISPNCYKGGKHVQKELQGLFVCKDKSL